MIRAWDASLFGACGSISAEGHDGIDDVVVLGTRIGNSRSEADVRRDDRRTGGRSDREVLGVGKATDVVADDRAHPVRRLRDRGPPRVDRDRHVEARAQRLDGRHDALELLGLGDLVAGPRLHSADVEQIGAVDDELLGLPQEVVEAVVAALVEERVGRAVQDAHHERPGGDVVAGVSELHLHGGEPSRRHRSTTQVAVAVTATTRVTTAARTPIATGGSISAARATASTHQIATAVGACITIAARSPRTPAGKPATRPHIIRGPTTGATSRFAGRAASGNDPNTGIAIGRDAELRAGGDAERLREPARARTPSGDGPGEQQDAERRPDGETEPDRPHEERIDEHQSRGGQGEQPHPRRRPAGRLRNGGEAGHGAGPQHGGLEAGDGREERDDDERRAGSPMQPKAPQQWTCRREDERHVLTRDRQQVSEAGGLEPRRSGVVDVSSIADHEAEKEAASALRQHVCSCAERAVHPVGGAVDRARRRSRDHTVDGEPRDHVPVRIPLSRRLRNRSHDPAHRDALTREQVVDRSCIGAVRPQLDMVMAESRDDLHASRSGRGVAEQGHPTGVARGGEGARPIGGPRREPRGEQATRDDEQKRTTERERRSGPGRGDPDRYGATERSTEHDDDREQNRREVAHRHLPPLDGWEGKWSA